jgi:GNAT superfamily N-acetyltransferase
MNKEGKVLIREYDNKDLERLNFIVRSTIKKSYSGIYPREAVDYFLELHSVENMKKDIPGGYTCMLELDREIVGTGSVVKNEMKRVFVLPEYQGRGFGKKIMVKLEENALNKGLKKVELCASLPSKDFYLYLGYKIIQFTYLKVKNDEKLEYYDMEKHLAER